METTIAWNSSEGRSKWHPFQKIRITEMIVVEQARMQVVDFA